MKRACLVGAAMQFLAISMVTAGEGPGAHFIENWDLDGDGKVTGEEARSRRSDVFASFDANEDGYLDTEEYELFDEARALDQAENAPEGMGRRLHNAADGMQLAVNDTDGDGKVSEAEFLDNAPAWIEMIDRNGDGVVSLTDFGPRN